MLLLKIIQTKPQVRNMKINFYDLYYTVIKSRDDDEIVDNHYENNDNEYFIYGVSITPNHYIGIKNDIVMLN